MKNNKIEQSIKESLIDFEMPYDPKAWESMSNVLDQRMPVSGKSNWKWYLGATAIIAVTSIAVYQSRDSIHKKNWRFSETSIPEKHILQSESNLSNTSIEKTTYSSSANHNKAKNNPTSENSFEKNSFLLFNNSAVTSNNSLSLQNDERVTKQNKINSAANNYDNKDNSSLKKQAITFPVVQDLCQGEIVLIKNENDVDIFISNNSKVYTISANNKISFEAENTGGYSFGYAENGSVIYSKSIDFKVKPSMSVDFTIDDRDKFDNGVPTIKFSVNSDELANYSWKIQGQKTEFTGKDVKAHIYNKGTYSVTLTATPREGGCVSKTSKNFEIDEDYNLLAVNSFWPQSNDPRNASFMPYALKERAVDFTMIVIDPSNGATIFETSDATNGWNGINKGNGQLVDANKVYIWIVRLKNPLPGEKSEYKGTIIRL